MQEIIGNAEFIDGIRVVRFPSIYRGKTVVITEDVMYTLTIQYEEDKKDESKTS